MKNLDKYLIQIQEGWIFSDKTISVDLHKFESGEKDKLLIIGFAGSGKTTLGMKLAKKYDCNYTELDDCYYTQDYLKCCYDKIKIPKERGVIEGVEILSVYFKNYQNIKKYINELPVIFMGTSFLISTFRAFKRELAPSKKWWRKSYEIELNKKMADMGGGGNKNSAIRDFFSNQLKTFRKERVRQKGSIVKIYKV